MIHKSQLQLQYPRSLSLTQLLLEFSLRDVSEDKPAVIDGLTGKIVYTYSSFRTSVKKVATYINNCLAIGRGARISILASNSVNISVDGRHIESHAGGSLQADTTCSPIIRYSFMVFLQLVQP